MPFARGLGIFFAVLIVAGLFVSADSAVPRVAYHVEGDFTRIVLNAANNTTATAVSSGKVLDIRLEPFGAVQQQGSGDTPQVAAWQLEGTGGRALLTVQTRLELKEGMYKVFNLPAGDGLPNRVVVDIGANLELKPLSVTAKTIAQPLAKPISSRTPPKPRMTVVIDPGHGGIDPGAVGFVVEKTTTLDVALKVRAILTAAGVTVKMTRSGDYAWQGVGGCDKRCDLDKRADMGSTDRNAFISIHVNSTIGNKAQGIETYLFGRSPDGETLAQAQRENGGGSVGKAITAQARGIASSLLGDQLAQLNASFSKRLANGVQVNLISQTKAVNLGVKQAEFWVIRKPRIPAVLVEMGFATHPIEGRNLGTQSYKQKIALGIARGILAFLGQ
jgi:N-acetylmuramoyl-L-alanine amidase